MKIQKIVKGPFKDLYRVFTNKNEFVATGLTEEEAKYMKSKVATDKLYEPKPKCYSYYNDGYSWDGYESWYGRGVYPSYMDAPVDKKDNKKKDVGKRWWEIESEPVVETADKTAIEQITADEINIQNHTDIVPPEEQEEWLKYYGLSEDDADEDFVDNQHSYLTDEQAEVQKALDEIDMIDEQFETNQNVGEFNELNGEIDEFLTHEGFFDKTP